MFFRLLSTTNDLSLTVLRLVLGVVFFAHGAQKMLGWYGGYGFDATMGAFTSQMGIPPVFAFLAIAAEFFGSLGLIFGVFTRIAAFGILSVMTVAIAVVHTQFGFFMNWSGAQQGEGYEFHLLVLAMSAVLILQGAGAFSIDRWLLTKSFAAEARQRNVRAGASAQP